MAPSCEGRFIFVPCFEDEYEVAHVVDTLNRVPVGAAPQSMWVSLFMS